jgi:hypothetical protein
MGLHENDDMELFTMESGGKEYICLSSAKEDVDRYKLAVELLQELNIGVPAELAIKVGLRD